MNVKSWLLLVGVAGITAAATDCQDKELRQYLDKNGGFYKALDEMSIAICQLETKAPAGTLDPTKRVCPTGPGDRKIVPGYPP